MDNLTSTVLHQTSLMLSVQEASQGYLRSLLIQAEGHDHIWILPEQCDFEISTRGYTQSIIEAFKDIASVC